MVVGPDGMEKPRRLRFRRRSEVAGISAMYFQISARHITQAQLEHHGQKIDYLSISCKMHAAP